MTYNEERRGLRTWIEIDTAALAQNYKTIRSAIPAGCKLMSVVKSNAYGHGLVDFSREIEKLGADWIGVDSIVEAMTLREKGIKTPMLVLGYTLPEMLEKAVELDVSISVSTFELLSVVKDMNFTKPLKIHVKVDTGMHRQGFLIKDVERVIGILKSVEDSVIVEGLFTHFAAAKNPPFPESVQAQLAEFQTWIEAFRAAGFSPLTHAAASGGAITFAEAHLDMVRIGIALYGLWPSAEVKERFAGKIPLKPILSWKTVISEIKKVPKGKCVGYDFTEECTRDTTLAVCPIGYWHGFPRLLSGVGEVLVGGTRAKVMGRVSMDMIIIDITDAGSAAVGDEVTIIGTDGAETIAAEDLARGSQTSAYEIVTRINPLIHKFYQ